MSMEFVTIYPALDEHGQPRPTTQSTKVMLPGGEYMPGVTKIELEGDVDDLWRAKIHCTARLSKNGVRAVPIYATSKFTLWQRLCARLGGLDLDVTDLDSDSREFWDGWRK